MRADFTDPSSYNRNMARRGIPKGPVLWYLRDWMATQNIVRQAQMMELTGWSKAKMSQLYNGQQDFNSEILAEAARALNIAPFELLMPPEQAQSYRRMREDAVRIAADKRVPFRAESETQEPTRKAS